MKTFTAEEIAGLTAIALSLIATYVPKFNAWHAGLPEDNKKLLWAVLLLAVTAGAVGWTCSGDGTCATMDWRGYLGDYVGALLLSIGASQGTYLLSPKPDAVKQASLSGKLRRGTD